MEQLLLFEEPLERKLQREIEILRMQCEKMRRGQYSKLTALQQDVKDLRAELEFLKSYICRELLI